MSQEAIERNLQLLEYNAIDSGATFQVMEEFWNEIYTEGHEDFYIQTMRMFPSLMYMMTRGIAVNEENLQQSRRDVEKQIAEKQEQLNIACGRELNFNSPKQVAAYFYIEKNITPYTNNKGKPTTDDTAMTRLARGTSNRKPLPEAKLIQELRGLSKLKGTYLEMDFDADRRFRTSINPRGTKFGRISSGKTIYETGMNMQNLPPSFKKFLVPDPGYLMIEMDKRQAEWVVVAYVCGDQNMIRVLEDGEDPHAHTASLMFHCDKDLIKAESKIVGHTTDPMEIEALRRQHCPEIFKLGFVPRIFSLRQGGKKSNHALNYDETYIAFAMHNEMTEKESKVIVERYHKIYPGIRNGHNFVQTELRKDRTLVNCFGQKCRFLEKWGSDLFKQAYAYKPQSTVAYVVNDALIETYDYEDPRLDQAENLGQVHDSILWQVPLSLPTEDILFCIKKYEDFLNPTMEYFGREFTIPSDIKMGLSNWNDLDEHDLYNKQALGKAIDGYKDTWRLANKLP